MKNHRQFIEEVLGKQKTGVVLVTDPNAIIDKNFTNPSFTWYPTYLAITDATYYMFVPFSFEGYADIDELKKECVAALTLINALHEIKIQAQVFFIITRVEDQAILESLKLQSQFGILHEELREPLLEFSVSPPRSYRLIPQVLEYLAQCTNLKGTIGDILREFSANYLHDPPPPEQEEQKIREFIDKILSCDKRFKLQAKSIQLISKLENLLSQVGYPLRDHYYHACNTLLIGYLAIDRFYDQFATLAFSYGDDIVIEFIWAVTALYHDIGYPASLQTALMVEAYDLSEDEAIVDACTRQARQQLWDSKYSNIADILGDLFEHTCENKAEKWVYDGFTHKRKSLDFINSIKSAFIERGAHGAQGVLILLSIINKVVVNLRKPSDRAFLYRHLAIAGISILFHDAAVRDSMKANKINQLKVVDFPLAGLLTYIDILQDDRRDLTGSVSRTDIFKDMVVENNSIRATLDCKAIAEETRAKLISELNEAFEFFIMNGITFLVPAELVVD